MSDIAIKVENLSKLYHIGAKKSGSLRETLEHSFNKLIGKKDAIDKAEEFWALKDVNFEIKKGEAVGIIGRNGAGKSTLLKILSRITEPTTGKITINGRVASLLEVGTGFHPELTGRENIFMNGAILGMKQAEIKRKFDEIVDFSGIEKFIDTPVKHYSSGMYVRLAFAVAAHLEPEILIIDEVLAVGDAEFQKKCLGKMNDVSSKEGRTILFVSHSMPMITSLCSKAFLFNSGYMVESGKPSDVILKYYNKQSSSPAKVNYENQSKTVGDETVILLEGYVKNKNGEIVPEVSIEEPVTIGMRYRIKKSRHIDEQSFTYPQLNFYLSSGELAFIAMAPVSESENITTGEYSAECNLPANFLNAETYFVSLGMATCDGHVRVHFYIDNALMFNVKEDLSRTLKTSRNNFSGLINGAVRPSLDWNISNVEKSVLAE